MSHDMADHYAEMLRRRWAPTLAQQPDELFGTGNDTWEDAVTEAVSDADAPHTGVMVAFFPTGAEAAELAVDGGEPVAELHLTLAFLGEVGAELSAQDEATVLAAVSAWAAQQPPVEGITNGHGVFANPEPVTYASFDSPALPAARQALVEALDAAGLPVARNHGYVPHITLAYAKADVAVPQLRMTFGEVVVAFAGNRTAIALTGTGAKPEQSAQAAPTGDQLLFHPAPSWTSSTPSITSAGGSITVNNTYTYPSITAVERDKWPTESTPIEPDITRAAGEPSAFVTEINGRTLVTGPAHAMNKLTQKSAFKEPTADDIAAEHMLWMHGRFVGGDAPNRNGALWSAGDLEMAKGTVTNGPLNWLHEARHVIGTLAQADFIKAGPLSAVGASESVDGFTQPHITATAAIWKWLYPDESYVIQQASEQEMLWYSMECISKQVACSGDIGCGKTVTYSQYMAGGACEHVTQRASVRKFINPVFLGGAVIVPPTRPGWADADARVMHTAESLAEAAFEQASAGGVEPAVSASLWEQMMAQLVRYANE